ncbi:hypothetical protein MWT96_20705 [Prescottella equi]|uniref:Uncharacterized protein n=1 Tax=Rhodococcus hoagii TaxID=43767 RepID=A0A9Q2PPR7_RHOHA|nr:hypothetical protein [Prescottella equi]MBM4489391.1 hypothetical protein [Prescottella equi]MBM4496214.1 hypothetical protein [Prescottella equi]MBM4497553.1 hypothetical protein [Prescottella equi]MBM4516236.1 hypothetical protein [Prescottella equi]MBM4567428.1 hypothetical protein [Prescottella equi]
MSIRDYLPNTSTRLALVSLDDQRPFRAYWPMRITQLVGGKTWSISFIKHSTPQRVETDGGRP